MPKGIRKGIPSGGLFLLIRNGQPEGDNWEGESKGLVAITQFKVLPNRASYSQQVRLQLID